MNLATKITVFRIFLAPLFVFCFIQSNGTKPIYLWATLIIAIFSEISDALDGIVARKYNLESDIGKVLDPLADSLARMSAFLSFLVLGYANIWMILIFFYRDSMVATLRIIAASKKIILGARTSGKIKAVVQAISIFGILITLLLKHYNIELPISYNQSIDSFMIVAVAITIYSLWDYLYFNKEVLKSIFE
ncbi:MAG: CDP-diacylglycerol--glycerol-3-phosphate 3-phosphatidyltransferase [Candidatus Cloacimonadota bacterium]|nr:MAG: CDP-diacylglycerol--glycerol-3-phosphate 3-phosphatidyltransferase [Candidatus Cloacimonadota bacterium]